MKRVELEKLQENFVQIIHQGWPVLTVQDDGKVNGMTVNWVQIGWLWNKPVVTVYVRPQRHTYPLINRENQFSLAFFDESERKNLAYLGKASGRDEDKLAHCGYTTTLIDGAPVIEQARLVLTLKKLYVSDIKEDAFSEPSIIDSAYPKKDFHRSFVAEIVSVLEQD